MSDLTSREDALKPFCVAPDGTRIPEVDCDNFPVEFSVEFIKKHLLSLPLAEPQGDLISRDDAMSKCKNAENELTDEAERKGVRVARFIIGEMPSAEHSKPLQTTLNSDLILREEAIEAFGLSEKTRKYGGDHSGYDTIMKYEIQDVLENLPSADVVRIEVYRELYEKYVELKHKLEQPQNDNWIPVSERLPSEDDYNEYLVIDEDGDMAVGVYRHDAKAWDSGNFGWLEIRDITHEFPWGIRKVVAWQPLPTPYKESEIEE